MTPHWSADLLVRSGHCTNDKEADLEVRAPARYGSAIAGWLSLAAAPTFAIMALLTVVGGPSDRLCAAAPDASPLNGMALMYLLMSAFHSAPWLKLVSGRRTDRPRP